MRRSKKVKCEDVTMDVPFDLKMRIRRRRLLAVLWTTVLLLLLGAGLWVHSNLMAVGRLQAVYPGVDRRSLMDVVIRTSLILQGTVVNAHTSLWLSARQAEVDDPQSCTVAHVRPTAVFKGHCDTNVIVSPAGWYPTFSHEVSSMRPFTNGQQFVFFLNRDWRLSRWCWVKVFRCEGPVPVPYRCGTLASPPP
jgi:hypothetical protein